MAYRVQHRFWLDLDKEADAELNDLAVYLKGERQFQSTIRDGMRLVYDLRAGQLDTLFELFPWVLSAFIEHMQAVHSSGGAGGNGGDDDGDLKRQLERLEQLILAQSKGVLMNSGGGPKPLNVPKVAGPVADDDEPELTIKKAKATGNSAQNFLDQAFGLIN